MNKEWNFDNIKKKVKVLKSNEVYRLGDGIKFKKTHKVIKHILSNSQYDNTILKLYHQDPSKKPDLYQIVKSKMALDKFQPHGESTLMVHMRLGDDIKRRGIGNPKNFALFVEKINTSKCARVKIVTALHYGTSCEKDALYSSNTYNYTVSNHTANIRKLQELIARLNKPVEIVSNDDVDVDVMHLVFCDHLLTSTTSGAFSKLVQNLHNEYRKKGIGN